VPPPLAIPVDGQLAGRDPAELALLAAEAERAGPARLWAAELHRSATVPVAVAAAATERIELGTGMAAAWLAERLVPALDAGAARAGRPRAEVACALICAASDDHPEGALRAAAGTVGLDATMRTYEGLADRLWAAPPHHMQGHETARWQRGILGALGTRDDA
jgi:hypothetical protein